MAKFQFTELVDDWNVKTVRLGPGLASAGNIPTDKDKLKFVKLVGDSRVDLAAVGDAIEGWLTSVEVATYDGYAIGGMARNDGCSRKEIIFDGLQGTPGTGTLAIGDYVVVGTVVPKGTSIGPIFAPRVCKATDQAGAKSSPFAMRVVSLGAAGTGAVSSYGIVEFAG